MILVFPKLAVTATTTGFTLFSLSFAVFSNPNATFCSTLRDIRYDKIADTKKTEKKFSTYKGRPLVRCNDEIYYGSMEEPYVIRMQIKSKKDVNGTEIADKVTVQLMATDPYLSPRKQLIKSSEKKGLFLAMDIADIWLERALANKM